MNNARVWLGYGRVFIDRGEGTRDDFVQRKRGGKALPPPPVQRQGPPGGGAFPGGGEPSLPGGGICRTFGVRPAGDPGGPGEKPLAGGTGLSLQEGGRYLLLDRLQDPGNLGTIIRGAEAFGVTALVLGPGCPDCFSPKVLRSTMGSLFRQPVFHTGDLPGSIRRMGEEGFAVYAAMLDPAARTVQQLPRSGGLGVVIGNEGRGVSPEVAAACAGSVYIPMAPAIESLNAAAAASVLMWEMCGRRGAPGVTPSGVPPESRPTRPLRGLNLAERR